jgi:hypothetical protein
MDDEGFWDAPAQFCSWLAANERFDLAGKQAGKANGPIGAIGQRIALEVARECGCRAEESAIGNLPKRLARALFSGRSSSAPSC